MNRRARRKAARALQQAALDSVYRLNGCVAAQAYVDHVGRRFHCPRCDGYGDDPEHSKPGSIGFGTYDPPERWPCDLCNGHGQVTPNGTDPLPTPVLPPTMQDEDLEEFWL